MPRLWSPDNESGDILATCLRLYDVDIKDGTNMLHAQPPTTETAYTYSLWRYYTYILRVGSRTSSIPQHQPIWVHQPLGLRLRCGGPSYNRHQWFLRFEVFFAYGSHFGFFCLRCVLLILVFPKSIGVGNASLFTLFLFTILVPLTPPSQPEKWRILSWILKKRTSNRITNTELRTNCPKIANKQNMNKRAFLHVTELKANHSWSRTPCPTVSALSWFVGSIMLGARLRGRTATQRSKKGSEKVLGRVLGKGFSEGLWEGFSEGVLSIEKKQIEKNKFQQQKKQKMNY